MMQLGAHTVINVTGRNDPDHEVHFIKVRKSHSTYYIRRGESIDFRWFAFLETNDLLSV